MVRSEMISSEIGCKTGCRLDIFLLILNHFSFLKLGMSSLDSIVGKRLMILSIALLKDATITFNLPRPERCESNHTRLL